MQRHTCIRQARSTRDSGLEEPCLRQARRTSRSSDGSSQKQEALRYILDAWEEALHDGIEPEMLANAALFAALADLITVYGEDAVAKMTAGLSRRIQHGEFTLKRTSQ
jgi:hypothetical protein